jgi:hypothetical protein
MLKKALSAAALGFLCVSFAAAQEDVGHFNVSLGWGAVFNKTSTSATSGVTVSPTNSGEILGTFRVRFNRMNGVEVTGARTDNSQIFILGTNDYRAQTSVTEFTGAYVLSPFHFEKIEPFLLAGGGLYVFIPVINTSMATPLPLPLPSRPPWLFCTAEEWIIAFGNASGCGCNTAG